MMLGDAIDCSKAPSFLERRLNTGVGVGLGDGGSGVVEAESGRLSVDGALEI